MPADVRELVEARAVAQGCSKAQALLHYVRLGIEADTGSAPATKADLLALGNLLREAIEQQPVALAAAHVEALPEPEPQQEHLPWWRRIFS